MKAKEKYSLNMHLARFGTDQACHDYLIQVRWGGKPTCPKCGNSHMNYYLTTRKIFKCSNKECYKQFSVIQGTIFEKSKISLSKWFLCIYLFTTKKRGVSSVQMAKWLGVKQHTAWFMLHRLRETLKDENNRILSGVVEADETLVMPKTHRDLRLKVAKWKHDKEQEKIHGFNRNRRLKQGIKFKRGRKKGSTKEVLQQKAIERGGKPYKAKPPSQREPFEKGPVVFGMVERGGRLVLKKLGRDVRCVTQENIQPLLKKHVSRASIFITDQNSVYANAPKMFTQHLTVNHEIGYVIDGIHNNNIENVWRQLKTMINGTYSHLSYHHTDSYLNEMTYRWNRRDETEQTLFEDFFHLIVGNRIQYKDLKQGEQSRAAA